MTVQEFNSSYAFTKINTHPLSLVEVLHKEGNEWYVRVEGKGLWVSVRKDIGKPTKTTTERKLTAPLTSSLSKEEAKLSPTTFKFYMFLKSLNSDYFQYSYASEYLGITIRTLRRCVKELHQTKQMKITQRGFNEWEFKCMQ